MLYVRCLQLCRKTGGQFCILQVPSKSHWISVACTFWSAETFFQVVYHHSTQFPCVWVCVNSSGRLNGTCSASQHTFGSLLLNLLPQNDITLTTISPSSCGARCGYFWHIVVGSVEQFFQCERAYIGYCVDKLVFVAVTESKSVIPQFG